MRRTERLDYRWVTVGLCILMIVVGLGFASSTRSLFPDEIAKELGVERSLVSLGDSFRFIATAVLNVFFGLLIARFGAKKLIFAGMLSLVAAAMIYALADSLVWIYLGGLLFGIGFSWTSTTMVGYVVDLWHFENRGTIMGIILASNGFGGAIAIQCVGGLIDPNITGSYRNGYFLIATVIAVAALLLLLFFRDSRQGEEASAQGRTVIQKKRRREWAGIPFSTAVHRTYFWVTLVCVFFSGFALQGTSGIVAMHLKDVGVDYGKVKALLSFGSLLLVGSKFFAGFLYDRKGLRFTANICSFSVVLSTLLLVFARGDTFGFVIAFLYEIIAKLALPLETVMLPIFAADLFGQHSYVKMLGILVSVNTAGYVGGSPVMNLSYDLFHSYVPALVGVSVIAACVFLLFQFVIFASEREKRACAIAEEQREACDLP